MPEDDERMRGNAWAKLYGLRWLDRLGHYSLAPLVRAGSHYDILKALDQRHETETALLDHALHFAVKGKTKTAVIITSPYLRTSLSQIGDAGKINARAYEVALSLGLNVRVGHPADAVYFGGTSVGKTPALPIVWWNPTRVELPFPDQTAVQ